MDQVQHDLDLKTIIDKIQTGDKQAYVTIIEQYQRPIYLYCYYMLRNQAEAEDAAQDTFLRSFRSIKTYTFTNSFSAWLYKIAKNICIDLIKKRNKEKQLTILYRDNKVQEQLSLHTDYIYECLDKLTDEERQILLLRSLEEYSYEEIAFIMDAKPSTVRKKYERLRKKLVKETRQGVNSFGHSH